MYFLGCLTLGHLSDRLGRRNASLAALGLAALALLGHYYSTHVWHLILFAGVYGCGMSLFWPTAEAWFSDLSADSPRGLERALGNFNVAWSCGMVLGALLGGVLWQALEVRAFLAPVALLGVVGLGLFRVPQPRRTEPAVHRHAHNGIRVDPAVTARFLLSARLVAFLSWFMTGVNLTILPKLAHEIHMPAGQTGLAIATYYVTVVVGFWVGRTSGRWQYRIWPIALPVPLALVGVAGLVVAQSVGPFMLACLIAGASTALSAATALYYALHGREEDLAHSTAIHEAVVGIGGVAGAVVSGLLAEALTVRLGLEPALRATFVMVAAVAVLIGGAQLVAWKLMGKQPSPPLPRRSIPI
jgi:MFS family permease